MDNRPNEEEKATDVNSELAAIFVSWKACDQSTDESAARGDGSDELLLMGIEMVAEIVADGDQNG